MNRYIIILTTVFTMLAVLIGCTGKQIGEDGEKMTETVWNARHNYEVGVEYDNQRHQMRIAELYYRKSYEILKDNPSQDWNIYAEAGYRYACLLYQRSDMEGALAIVSELLKEAKDNGDFPRVPQAFLLSLMAQCQLQLAMPEAAKQTFGKAYEQQLNVLGGEEKGDFNLAIMCSDIFWAFFQIGEYDEAGKWLSRYEEEFRACERLGVGDSLIILEHNGLLSLYKAQYLEATGRAKDAAAIYDAIPQRQLDNPSCIENATGYLMAAGRYAEAADMYARLDTTYAAADSARMTFDKISECLAPRYAANRKTGVIAEALATADKAFAAIDSALVWQERSNAAELAVIYQIHERDLQLKDLRFTISLHRLIIIAAAIIILLIIFFLRRTYKYNKVLAAKNRKLYEKIELNRQEQQHEMAQLQTMSEAELTANQQLYRRICTLMDEQQAYTDKALNRDSLAQMQGTNTKYLGQAIHECSHGESVGDFINRYRLEHVTRLLKTTNEPIAIIGELSGIPSRATLARLFRNAYGMTPTEYRQIRDER